jgi:signal peptidase I
MTTTTDGAAAAPVVTAVIIVALAALMAAVVRRRLVWVTRVTSWSMAPSLRPGDRLLTWGVRDPARLRRGDVVVIDSIELGRRVVKRVIGLPRERVMVTAEGVWVDGARLDEPWSTVAGGLERSFDVPEDRLLVLGDNRPASSDSRSWLDPYVPLERVVGRARHRRPHRPSPSVARDEGCPQSGRRRRSLRRPCEARHEGPNG